MTVAWSRAAIGGLPAGFLRGPKINFVVKMISSTLFVVVVVVVILRNLSSPVPIVIHSC